MASRSWTFILPVTTGKALLILLDLILQLSSLLQSVLLQHILNLLVDASKKHLFVPLRLPSEFERLHGGEIDAIAWVSLHPDANLGCSTCESP